MWFGIGLVGVVESLVFFEWWEFDSDSVGSGLFEIVAEETREHDSDIVFTAAIVSLFDQRSHALARSPLLSMTIC